MKKIPKVLIIILAVVAVIALFKNVLIKSVAEQAIKTATGFPLKMGSFKLGIINSYVDIKDLKLFNPKGFEEEIFVDIPEIHVDYNLLPLLKGKIHVVDFRFNMRDVRLVTNKDGETNINRLKALQPQKKEGEQTGQEKKEKKSQEITIDHLLLKVDQVTMIDYSKGSKPSQKAIAIALNYEAENINNINALIMIIASKTMVSAGMSNLLSIDPTGVLSGVTGTVGQTAEKVIGGATDTLMKTTEGLKGIIKSPFGKTE